MTNLGIPVVPTQTRRPVGSGVEFSNTGHYFEAPVDLDVHALADAAAVPLSVIVQVTKRCNFDCNMCSEILQMPDPTIDQLDTMRENLSDVARVFLSGGEPMMRKDFSDIVEMWHKDAILAVPTNATHGMEHAKNIAGKIAYANVGFKGPPRCVPAHPRPGVRPDDGRHPRLPGARHPDLAVRGRHPLLPAVNAVRDADRRRP
ncbi:radical SAM protein [Streptomyces sp. NPDC001970]